MSLWSLIHTLRKNADQEMTRQSLQPTEVTFGALAKTAAEDSNWLVVLELLNEMERVEVKASVGYQNQMFPKRTAALVPTCYRHPTICRS